MFWFIFIVWLCLNTSAIQPDLFLLQWSNAHTIYSLLNVSLGNATAMSTSGCTNGENSFENLRENLRGHAHFHTRIATLLEHYYYLLLFVKCWTMSSGIDKH